MGGRSSLLLPRKASRPGCKFRLCQVKNRAALRQRQAKRLESKYLKTSKGDTLFQLLERPDFRLSPVSPSCFNWPVRDQPGNLPSWVIISALEFAFRLQGNYRSPTQWKTDVSGLIKGLQANKNEQLSGISVIITSATNSPPEGWPEFATIVAGKGFSVSGGVITDLDALFIENGRIFSRGYPGWHASKFYHTLASGAVHNTLIDNHPGRLVFSPSQAPAVPGPLPLLAVGSAFRFSRQLRPLSSRPGVVPCHSLSQARGFHFGLKWGLLKKRTAF